MQFKLQTSLLAAILATTALGAAIEPTLTATEPAVPAPTGESENFSAAASNLITVCKDYDFKGCTNFSGTEGTCCKSMDQLHTWHWIHILILPLLICR